MKRILIVDDCRVMRELTKVYLIARDVEIVEAGDGQEGLERARARRPDLVLADLVMPRMDGPALCAALAERPETRGVPVVILTASRDPEPIRRALAAGAKDVLHKPIQPKALHVVVERWLAPGAHPAHGPALAAAAIARR